MSDTSNYPLTGRCQCGAIEYSVAEPFALQVVCHCTECQKYTAAAFGITVMINSEAFTITKGQLRKWTRSADSGNTNDCYFCAGCGNRIYHQNPDKPRIIKLKPGTLDDVSVIAPEMHVWVKSKQPWVQIPQGIKQYDTQPEF